MAIWWQISRYDCAKTLSAPCRSNLSQIKGQRGYPASSGVHFVTHVAICIKWRLFIEMVTDRQESEVEVTCATAVGPVSRQSMPSEWISASTVHFGLCVLLVSPGNWSLIWQRMRTVSRATFRKMATEDGPANRSREKKDRKRTPSLLHFRSCSSQKCYPRSFGSQYFVHEICSLAANSQLEWLLTSRSSKLGGQPPTKSMTNYLEFLKI